MANDELRISRCDLVSKELNELFSEFVVAALAHRGGTALIDELFDDNKRDLAVLVERDCVWKISRSEELAGFAVVQGFTLMALMVKPTVRRQGIARAALQLLLREMPNLRDGLSLPGDRSTKSLYESVGWKARLLTMRAE